jgi:hypothetical protein
MRFKKFIAPELWDLIGTLKVGHMLLMVNI